MDNFIYSIPTRIYFGKGQVAALGPAIKEFGGTRVLLAYGGGSVKKYGILDQVTAQLEAHGIGFAELSGIKPNPRIESVYQGIETYRAEDCDFVLGVGGGSTLDASKAVAAGVAYGGDVMDLFLGKAPVTDSAPMAAVLTMAGTGSEMNVNSVVTTGDDHKKRIIRHPSMFPKFSILDPAYTFSVPMHHAMAGAADILCHLMEQYFGTETGARVQDRMNEGLMRSVVDEAPRALADPGDYDVRANLMWASSLALAGFQFMLGKPGFKFPLHAMGHELSSLYDMTHGVTLALITPAWMRQTMRLAPASVPQFAAFARAVFGVAEADDAAAAEAGVQRLLDFYAAIGMPRSLREAGVAEDKLGYLAAKAVENGPLGVLTSIGEAEALDILRQSF